ncbi:MAG TPA: PBP1A family penicillin-binding protein [Gemmatimonadaceae bacterium]|nr:PBP1A family penicillin-binding protein [Gemmatimonadaceae bacterium]
MLAHRLAIGGTFALAFGTGLFAATWSRICAADQCPDLATLEAFKPMQTSTLFAIDGRFIAEVGLERRTLVPLKEIPRAVREAFIITEDKRFYSHSGIDWWRIPGAVFHNVRTGSFGQGFSTISMQLARNIFPAQITREKTPVRKLREIRVARAIEWRYSKDKILELYLNQINLGSGAYGVETASRRYFGKSVRDLNLAEAATLAALPKAPNRYNPRRYPDRAIMRRNTVIELMRRHGVINHEQANLARAYPLRLARRIESGDVAPYFVEWVRRQLEEKFGNRIYEQGLRVFTTLDLDMQHAAERALENQLRAIESGRYGAFTHESYEHFIARSLNTQEESGRETPYIQGSFVAMDPRNGSVRALVGGRDYEDSKFNRAAQALRQPGSTFKPIVYSAAIQRGYSPGSPVDDSPVAVNQEDGTTWTPQNFDGKFFGTISMRRAIYQSRNLAAIDMGMALGERTVISQARSMGLTTPIPPYPSIFIGSADVHPIEMVASYTTFANLGEYVEPTGIVRVETANGEVIWEPSARRAFVLSPGEAWLMVSMMKDVVQRGTAANIWSSGFHVPAAGKTGTTNDGTDVWYIGYTADLVAGVWMGFDRPKKIKANAQGGILASPAYLAFVKEVYNRKPPPPDWPRPATVIEQVIDLSPDCSGTATYVDYALIGSGSSHCAGATADIFQIGTPPPPDTPRTGGPRSPTSPPASAQAKGGGVGKRDSLANLFKIPN